MKNIEIKILNPEDIQKAEQMMVFCARLTQRGHEIKNMDDLLELHHRSYKESTVRTMTNLPHYTIQKFGVINIAIVGASRRFLAQVTRHQNEVKFMSASLQYSDYSGAADFVIPYEVTRTNTEEEYIQSCERQMTKYAKYAKLVDNDSAGYLAPQCLRNILIISATPFQLKHMIGQRICRRNTTESRYVMLKIWEELYKLSPNMFSIRTTGAGCQRDKCQEGPMCCGVLMGKNFLPSDTLREDFPLFYDKR
jgi:thymidylate synthase (FAD)